MKSHRFAILAALLAVAASVYAVWGTPAAYPIDDAYIHFAYADNLASGAGLVFQSPGEVSVGSTSILWVLLLAGGARLGLPSVELARILGILAHAAAAALMAVLVEPAAARWRVPWLPLAAGGLTAVCGPLVWFSLSGMETMLFAALGLAALLYYRAGRQMGLGVCLGLLFLTRPEGLGLGLAVALAEAWRTRRLPLHLWRAGVMAAVLMLPWMVYLFFRTGVPLPGSYYGKQFTQEIAIEFFAARSPVLRALAEIRPVVFAALTLGYWCLYFWGGAFLPGPGLEVPVPLDRAGIALLAGPVALLWVCLAGRGLWLLHRRRAELPAGEKQMWVAFGLWMLIHNGAFALLLPAPGTASRYIAVDYLMFAAGVAVGLAPITGWPASLAHTSRRATALLWAGGTAVGAIALGTLGYWRTVYESSAQQVAQVRIAMAQEISESTPPQAVVAAFDIGVIGYYSPQPMVDLGGLTDSRVLEFAEERQMDQYLCSVQADYLVAPDSNRAGGGSYYDYLGSLGLSSDPNVSLVEIDRTGMNVDEWRPGGAATGNSTAAVLLYRVDPKCD